MNPRVSGSRAGRTAHVSSSVCEPDRVNEASNLPVTGSSDVDRLPMAGGIALGPQSIAMVVR